MYPHSIHPNYIPSSAFHPFAYKNEDMESDCILLDAEFDEEQQIFILAHPAAEVSDDAEWDEEVLAEAV